MNSVRVMDENWRYLIVLDACRYDYFSLIQNLYFHGNLKMVVSPGSTTPEWCVKSFTEYYRDVIYISSNPYISSKYCVSKFDAKKHFFKIVDVWNYGWNDAFGTVFPEKVSEALLHLKEENPDTRFIIHYLQPHAPYISKNFLSLGYRRPGRVETPLTGVQDLFEKRPFKEIKKMLNLFEFYGCKLGLGNLYLWKLEERFGLPPIVPMEATRRMFGVEGLRRAYFENLKMVLKHVAVVVGKLRGQVVITSDHGELLGEGGRFGHPPGSKNALLRNVPWYEVITVKEVDMEFNNENNDQGAR